MDILEAKEKKKRKEEKRMKKYHDSDDEAEAPKKKKKDYVDPHGNKIMKFTVVDKWGEKHEIEVNNVYSFT